MRRIESLDLLRGVAILGTLGTNTWFFTSPGGPGDVFGSVPGGFETFLRFLANGKFLGLLTLLFGVGLELQYRSAVRRGLRWPGAYPWRAALLFTEGLLHYILIFEFDVLMSYAVTAVLVAYLIGRSDRAVRRWMIAMGAVHVIGVSLVTAALLAVGDAAPDGSAAAPASYVSWADQVRTRIEDIVVYRLEAVFILPMSVLLFLLGARLYRAGVFEETGRGARLRVRLMALGAAALPVNLVTAYAGPAWFAVDRYVLPPMVALGLLGLIVEVALRMRGAPGVLRAGLNNVGRAALSCYVFQNLVASALCYDWGLDLADRLAHLRPWWVPPLWLAVCAAFMILSTLWLRRRPRAPLEALWHRAYTLPRREAPVPAPAQAAPPPEG